MLQVSRAQLTQLSRLREVSFARDVAHELRTAFAAEIAGLRLAPHVDRLVALGIDRARSYGIRDEADIRAYIQCLVLLAPNFDRAEQFRWAGEILRSPGWSGEEKMKRIGEHMLFAMERPL